jgi:hypothetical protein
MIGKAASPKGSHAGRRATSELELASRLAGGRAPQPGWVAAGHACAEAASAEQGPRSGLDLDVLLGAVVCSSIP